MVTILKNILLGAGVIFIGVGLWLAFKPGSLYLNFLVSGFGFCVICLIIDMQERIGKLEALVRALPDVFDRQAQ